MACNTLNSTEGSAWLEEETKIGEMEMEGEGKVGHNVSC